MSAASAFAFLLVAEGRNRARTAVRRLRSPRHLVAVLFGGAWLVHVATRQRVNIARGLDGFGLGDLAWAAELVALAAVAVVIMASWVLGRDAAPLWFSEAEIQLLFPAPLTRRQLVLYRLARFAAAHAAAVIVFTALLGRGGPAERAVTALGGWIALATWNLHMVGAALTRASLARRGASVAQIRALAFGAVALAAACAAVGVWRAPPLDAFGPGAAGLLAWTRSAAESAPLSWLLQPLRASLDLTFAPGAGRVAAALPAALAVLAAHLAWVLSMDGAFEQAAVDDARRLGARLDALRSGSLRIGRARSPGFLRLGSAGRPETAFAWKGLIRASRFLSIPAAAFAAAVVLTLATVVFAVGGSGRADDVVAILALAFFLITVAVGPLLATGDLRRDLPHLELLRSLPVRGREVIVGELAVPLLQLTVVQWLLLAPAVLVSDSAFPWTLGERVALGVALGILGPSISAAGLVVLNAIAVLYPGWYPRPGEPTVSLERMGIPVMMGVGSTLVAVLVAFPAAIVGGVVAAVLWRPLGVHAAPIAALPAAGVVWAALALAVAALGRAFDRLDPEP